MSSIADRVRSKLWIVVGLLLLFSVPDVTRVSDSLQLLVIQQGILFGFAALGLNLLLRHTRLVSFGHAAFFGTGAYAVALLATSNADRLLGGPEITGFALLMAGAIVASVVVAAIIGALSLRHTGLYFSLLTLAFGQLLYAIVQSGNTLFNGSDGITVRPGEANRVLLFGIDLGDNYSILMYYVTAVIVVIGLYVMYRLANSPFGMALSAIGQNRTRAEFIGLPVKRYVWVAFVISGVYAGVAGGLFAITDQFVEPAETLYFLKSGDILFMAILGGFQTLVGPIVGGVVLELLLDLGADYFMNLDSLVAGVALILMVFAFPEGIVGSIKPGGRIYEGGRRFVRTPSVVGEWVRRAAVGTVDALRRSIGNVRVLLFGVK